MTDAGERARLKKFLSAAFSWIDSKGFDTPKAIRGLAEAINDIRYTDHERNPAEIIAAALAALETENAELRRERSRDALDGQAALDEANNLVVTLKAEVDRLLGAQRTLEGLVIAANRQRREVQAKLDAATSAEAVKVNEQELAEVIATAIWHTPAGCEIDHLSVARQVIAFYDRAQAQKEEKHGPGTDH